MFFQNVLFHKIFHSPLKNSCSIILFSYLFWRVKSMVLDNMVAYPKTKIYIIYRHNLVPYLGHCDCFPSEPKHFWCQDLFIDPAWISALCVTHKTLSGQHNVFYGVHATVDQQCVPPLCLCKLFSLSPKTAPLQFSALDKKVANSAFSCFKALHVNAINRQGHINEDKMIILSWDMK